MKKFLIKLLIFSTPIIISWISITIVDPCNFYNIFKIVDDNSKLKIINRSYDSQTYGNILWKWLEFKRKPIKNIIIGDSQSYFIKTDLIKELTAENYYNFSIPGANPETKFSIFWFATKQVKLNHVVIQLSFPKWNINDEDHNLFDLTQDYINKPYLYLFSPTVLMDSFQNIRYKLTGEYEKGINKIQFPITNEKNQIFDFYLQGIYKIYIYPDKYVDELKKISNYCNYNHISLEIIIFPIHQRYFNYLSNHKLEQFNNRFIADLHELCTIHNFSTDSIINKNQNNFKDYFHQNQIITDSLTCRIWEKRILHQSRDINN